MKTRFLLFFLSVLAVFGFATFYVGLHLTMNLSPNSAASSSTWGILGLGMSLLVASPFVARMNKKADPIVRRRLLRLNLGAYTFFSTLVLLLFFFFVCDLLSVIPGFHELFRGEQPTAVLALSGLLMILGFRTAAMGPEVVEVRVPHENLHQDLAGLRIVQISDLHVGGQIGGDYVAKVVEQCNALKPDIIALTGDIMDSPFEQCQHDLSPLSRLKSSEGVFFVTGNHEYIWGADVIQNHFRQMGFHVLNNEHRAVARGAATLIVAGVPDLSATRLGAGAVGPDPVRAMHGAPKNDFVILLCHQPNAVGMTEEIPCNLQLSGHTHGGQFFPFHWFVGFFNRYTRGLHRHKDKFWIYVNRATGYWGPPNRLGIRAEITLLILSPTPSFTAT